MRANGFGGFGTYTEYLQGKHWKGLRKALCLKPESKCGGCSSKHHLQIHHISYDRLGKELPEDLVVLCDGCHKRVHDELDRLYPGRSTAWQTLRTRYIFPLLFDRTLDEAQTHVAKRVAKAAKRKKRKKNSRKRKSKKAKGGRYATLPVNFAKSKMFQSHGATSKRHLDDSFGTFRAKRPPVQNPRLQPRPEDQIPSVLAKMFGLRESRG